MKKFLALFLLTIILVIQGWGANGLNASYYNDNSSSSNSWSTTPVLTRIDSNIDFQWGNNAPATGVNADRFSIVWSGYLNVPETANYTFYVAYDDYIDITIDGTQLYSNGTWTGGASNYNSFTVTGLTKGYHSIQIRFKEYAGGAYARVAWKNNASITTQVIIPSTNLFTALPTIAEYRMDDESWNGTAGEVKDSTSNGYNGQALSMSTTANGLLCQGGDFTGTTISDYVSLPSTVLNGKSNFTVSTWIKTSKTSNQAILSAANSSGSYNQLLIFPTSTSTSVYVKEAYKTFTTPNIANNAWHHLAVSRDGSSGAVCVYVDGSLSGCQTMSTGALSVSTGGLILGQEQDSLGGGFDVAQSFIGLMDEFKIFDDVLDATAIATVNGNENSGKNWDGSSRTCPVYVPTLSAIGVSNVTQTTASLSATPSAGGTLYYVITASATPPSATQIKAGLNDTGSTAVLSGSGTAATLVQNTFALTPLTSGTTYYAYLVMTSSSGTNSAVYSSSPFTTLPPSVSILTPQALPEGNSGTTPMMFQIAVTNPNNTAITLKVNTADGTATAAGNDYLPISNQTITIPANTTLFNYNVSIVGDTDPSESDETFSVIISNPTNATISVNTATGTILNDDMATCSNASDWAVLNNYGDSSSTISGSVSNGYDDYFKIVVGVDGKLDITYTANQKTNFYLMDSSCAAIASKTSSTSGTLSYVVDAGTYYLKISRSGNADYSNVKATLSFPDENWKDFELLKQYNLLGSIKAIGNSALCKSSNNTASGTCTAPSTTVGNGSIYALYADVDSDSSTTSSSSADLDLPSGATVKWAGLFWAGRLGSGKTTAEKLAAKVLKLKLPGASAYTTVTAQDFNWATTSFAYKGYKDITSLMNQSSPNGTYYVSDIKTALGSNAYAAWSLFVVYELSGETYKNISIYDGFFSIQNSANADLGQFKTKDVPISGFLTPTNGTVNSRLLLFSSEGDVDLKNDSLQMTNKAGTFTTISNSPNPSNNPFNSTITENGTYVTSRNPAYQNTIGIDLDTFDVSSIMQNGQTSTTIRFSTNQDQYFPSALAFSTELYLPNVCYEESITKNGVTVTNAQLNDIVDINVSVTNKNPEAAKRVVITKIFDDSIGYIGSSSSIKRSTDTAFIAKTDASGDDTVTYDSGEKKLTFNLGPDATALLGGTISQNQIEQFKMQARLLQLGTISSDYKISFNDGSGGTDYTEIAIAKCSKLPSTTITIKPSGVARIVEQGKAWSDNDGALFTKTAGQSYTYDILFAVDEAGTSLTTGKIKKVELWDILNNQLISTPISTLTTVTQRLSVSIPLNAVYKRVQFKITQEDDKVSTSNDFTIRPAYLSGTITSAKTGVSKSLSDGSIKSYKIDNALATGYSASFVFANIKNLNFPPAKVCTSDQPAEMIDSFATTLSAGASSSGSITFKDVGDFNITLFDYSWSAQSDDAGNGGCILNSASNTPDANGKIGCNVEGQVTVSVSPYQFSVISAYGGGDWKYMVTQLSDQNTTYAGVLEAQGSDGGPTLNFSSTCFASDESVFFNFSLDRASSLFASDLNGTTLFATSPKAFTVGNHAITIPVPSAHFVDGSADFGVIAAMYKNGSVPQNPTLLSAKDFTPNTSSTNIAFDYPADSATDFLYGRIRTYDLTTNTTPSPNPVEFEIYSSSYSGYVKDNQMPQNVLHWYRNTNHDSTLNGKIIRGGFTAGVTDGEIDVSLQPQNGIQIVSVDSEVDKTVHLDISRWLWYSPGKTYNYATGSDCSYHPCFHYDFNALSSSVKGVSSGSFNGSDFQTPPAENITNKGIKLFR